MECNCRVVHLSYGETEIEYCSKHKAAPKLYEALKGIIDKRMECHEMEAAYIPPEIELAYKALAEVKNELY